MLSHFSIIAQTSDHDTLEIVNWNLEFFGDNNSNLPAEMTKTRTIMNALNADIYALTEIVNTDSLKSLTQSLNGYNYLVSPFGSFASSPSSSQYKSAQKLAFVYRSSVVRNVSGRALLRTSSSAYNYWASGRFPYLVSAEVLGKDNQWRQFQFVIIHAKANSDYSSCFRRYAGALELKDTLDTYFANDRIILLGDFNDDLDVSICASFTESNYAEFVKDSIDGNSYKALTLPLSLNGVSSIAGYPGFIDHVLVSNEVASFYIPGSAAMLEDKVTSWVSSYTSDVSDHYPVLTKYVMDQATPVQNIYDEPSVSIYPVPAKNVLFIKMKDQQFETYEIFSFNGRRCGGGKFVGNLTEIALNLFASGTYFITISGNGENGAMVFTVIK